MNDFYLPFEKKPMVSYYLLQAHTMGIIQANARLLNQDITPWLCSKFINCSFIDSRADAKFGVEVFDGGATNDGKIHRETTSINKSDLTDVEYLWNLVSDFLKSGFYVKGVFNEKYIPDMDSFMKKDYVHPYLLYGYDNNTHSYTGAGYLKNHLYNSYSVDYMNYYESIVNTPDDIYVFELVKYVEDSWYVVNYPRTIKAFEDYLTSRNTIREDEYPEDEVFGITALKCLRDYYMRILDKDSEYFDMRYSRALMESKKVLVTVIDYLYRYFNMSSKNYTELAAQAASEASVIHNMGLLYNMTQDKDIIERIYPHFEKILGIELSYLPCILEDLKSITHFPEGTYVGPVG